MSTNNIAYVEFPATSTDEIKKFYGTLFGWSFQDWGTDYTTFSEAGLDGGFNAGDEHRTKAPLIVIETDNIHEMEVRVHQTGGTITTPTFKFPGGSRFHFKDPAGNELAVMQVE